MNQKVISRSPDVMSGTPMFAGTRVPVQTLLDYLEAGESIDDFLEGFPSVTRTQVIAFLEEAKDRIIEAASQPRERLKRRLGALAGVADIPADFDAPLPDDVIDAFEGR
jgi:uncharacterized protein (DUF433 family)